MQPNYYSQDWASATDKFVRAASKFGLVKWATEPGFAYKIPYVSIGHGSEKIVINSGVHGIEGYFGSAAQLMFLDKIAPKLSEKFLDKYTLVLIHVINGWGMDNRMREVLDPNGGLVDLNRNFGVDFSKPDKLPQNPKYKYAHDVILSKPKAVRGQQTKYQRLLKFRHENLENGVWASIMRGQYTHPYGLAYGGNMQMTENKLTMQIYDDVMRDASGLISIGLHTGLGRFYKKQGYVTTNLQVSHPVDHPNSVKFREIFESVTQIDSGVPLLGDLVDCLESRYEKCGSVFTADFEIGTGETLVRSQVLKRMDMGDARYDLMHGGKINATTRRNLTESWYPSHPAWRRSAMEKAENFLGRLIDYLEKQE